MRQFTQLSPLTGSSPCQFHLSPRHREIAGSEFLSRAPDSLDGVKPIHLAICKVPLRPADGQLFFETATIDFNFYDFLLPQ